jgi:membrane protease YdiL (CAAX protease family)
MYSDLLLKFTGFLLPLFLIGSTMIAFDYFRKRFGPVNGYLLGFLFYWIFWCLIIPLLLLDAVEVESLFRLNGQMFSKSGIINTLFLIIPLVLAYSFSFRKAIKNVTVSIVVISLLLAIINATMEELLWRGLYLKLLGSDKWIYIFYSSFAFAVWHFAPQSVLPNRQPGGQLSFVAFTFVLGVLFSIVSFNSNSILLVTVAHILFDFSGMGGRIYSSSSLNLPSLTENSYNDTLSDTIQIKNR